MTLLQGGLAKGEPCESNRCECDSLVNSLRAQQLMSNVAGGVHSCAAAVPNSSAPEGYQRRVKASGWGLCRVDLRCSALGNRIHATDVQFSTQRPPRPHNVRAGPSCCGVVRRTLGRTTQSCFEVLLWQSDCRFDFGKHTAMALLAQAGRAPIRKQILDRQNWGANRFRVQRAT